MKWELKVVVDTDRIAGFVKRSLARRRVRVGLGLALCSPVMVYAVTVPNSFTDGTVVSASQMNANFAALVKAVNLLEGTSPAATCKDIYDANTSSPDGHYYIDPDGSSGLRPFQVWCDMTNGGWMRVDTRSYYPFAIHTEAERQQSYAYELNAAQINAIRAKSSSAKQEWSCQTLGVGSVYRLIGWDNNSVNFAQCYAPDNSAYVSSSGTYTVFAQIPFKSWGAQDCGDVTEACQHNVAPAYFR